MPAFSHRAAAAYRNVDVNTRATEHDQYELALMMFEAVLDSVTMAQGAIASGDVSLKVKQINRAVKILQDGLRTSLDLEQGGELAQNLDALYDYCVLRLTEANAFNDSNKLAEVTQLIKPLAEAWLQMRNGATAGPQAAEGSIAVASNPKAPPGARRMSNLYGSGMALIGA